MPDVSREPVRVSAREAEEIRALLPRLHHDRPAERRVARARLRRMGIQLLEGAAPPLEDLIVVSDARRPITRQSSGRVFRVAVGVTGRPVRETWSAFDQRYQWFGKQPQSVASGDHLFVLAVDRWRSAVVGLYETVSPGAQKLPGSPDADRWPFALGVRPLAAIPPPLATRVDGQRGPQGGLPERVSDSAAQAALYAAVASSPPSPGPTTLEQRVQELEWQDVADDVIAAVEELGAAAQPGEVTRRALVLGGWSPEELAARAWYTGTTEESHIRQIVRTALRNETVLRDGRLGRRSGGAPYAARPDAFGAPYREAADDAPAPDHAPHEIDLAKLDAATARHMAMQNELADLLRERGIEPRSPANWQPRFDLAFSRDGHRYVVEVKGGEPVSAQQVRLGVGQVLEYRHQIAGARAVLLLEGPPPPPWDVLLPQLDIALLRADDLGPSLDALISS